MPSRQIHLSLSDPVMDPETTNLVKRIQRLGRKDMAWDISPWIARKIIGEVEVKPLDSDGEIRAKMLLWMSRK